MTLEEIKMAVSKVKKGAFVNIEYKSENEKKGSIITKVTNGVYRLSIAYANMKVNADKIIGERTYGDYLEDYQNAILEYKKDGEIAPRYYLRVYTVDNSIPNVKYFKDGISVSKQELLDNGYIKERKDHPILFNVKIENVLKIGK